MKKRLLILVLLVVAIGAGTYIWRAQTTHLDAKDVTPQELKQMIEQDDNFFVYFYAPICPNCIKAKPYIAQAVQLSKVRMVALDVLKYPDIKTELQVPGTPSIYYYKNHKLTKGITGALANAQGYVDFFRNALATP